MYDAVKLPASKTNTSRGYGILMKWKDAIHPSIWIPYFQLRREASSQGWYFE
jgi:hypothetical protein